MVVDASALLAIYLNEPERPEFLAAIEAVESPIIAPVNVWEALVRAYSLHGPAGRDRMADLIVQLGLYTPPCTLDDAREAAFAFERFGRGRPAGLNLGDCFAYALARTRGAALLFKGEDFRKTDAVVVE
ncbi:MAG: type II toxin-antitoxin system VapC family toxin [Alphaproteobacteria bacterium]|nr:type II toxin-antitoxin system VapC family toxin [Alphaproteobacteria bacterium]